MKLRNVFFGKTVLITGHTGFKGTWLSAWLSSLGASVVGIALDPPTSPSMFHAMSDEMNLRDIRLDIRNKTELMNVVSSVSPDFVFHLAAQSLVKVSYQSPIETWEVNLLGTVNMLEALRLLRKKCVAVFITSDKCYDNKEWVWGYRENDRLGGSDPYSGSKGGAELAIRSYVESFFKDKSLIHVASARAGNVIGGGDWADDRIVPDAVKAWSAGRKLELRAPYSTRPWQHVLEPLGGYLLLAAKLDSNLHLHGESFNFGPNDSKSHTVLDLVEEMGKSWPGSGWNIHEQICAHSGESRLLKLNCDKAQLELGWSSALNFEKTVKMTTDWYMNYLHNPSNVYGQTSDQIKQYQKLVEEHWGV